MDLVDELYDFVTVGGHSRLKKAKAAYEATYKLYAQRHEEAVKLNTNLNRTLEELGKTTQSAFMVLKQAHRVLKKAQPKRAIFDVRYQSERPHFDQNRQTVLLLSNYSNTVAMSQGARGGLSVGSTAAIGSWSLVSMLGSASTGAPITSLYGAAATNATLAWFGGGSLAAGGAGMAGGAMTLGAIVIIPALVLAVFNVHVKANDLDSEVVKLKDAINDLNGAIEQVHLCSAAVAKHSVLLHSAYNGLVAQYTQAERLLFPDGTYSKIKRSIRSFFGGRYYSDDELPALSHLDHQVREFTKCFSSEVSNDVQPSRQQVSSITKIFMVGVPILLIGIGFLLLFFVFKGAIILNTFLPENAPQYASHFNQEVVKMEATPASIISPQVSSSQESISETSDHVSNGNADNSPSSIETETRSFNKPVVDSTNFEGQSNAEAVKSAFAGEHYPETRQKLMSSEDVARMSYSQARYAINEAYARHGLRFKDETLRNYFDQFNWFIPVDGQTAEQTEQTFTDVERVNVHRLAARRDYLFKQGHR